MTQRIAIIVLIALVVGYIAGKQGGQQSSAPQNWQYEVIAEAQAPDVPFTTDQKAAAYTCIQSLRTLTMPSTAMSQTPAYQTLLAEMNRDVTTQLSYVPKSPLKQSLSEAQLKFSTSKSSSDESRKQALEALSKAEEEFKRITEQ